MEDRINLHQLMELKAAFERADTDQGGSPRHGGVPRGFGGVLRASSDGRNAHLFMKIDADSDGSRLKARVHPACC